jgi:hypothetical protein
MFRLHFGSVAESSPHEGLGEETVLEENQNIWKQVLVSLSLDNP